MDSVKNSSILRISKGKIETNLQTMISHVLVLKYRGFLWQLERACKVDTALEKKNTLKNKKKPVSCDKG